MKKPAIALLTLLAIASAVGVVRTQDAGQKPAEKPVLYLVSTAHLDTQWNWTVQDTIRQFVPSTFFDNFKLFEKYPHYVFTFEGAIHYMWFKEYHPEAWATLQKYVANDRWRLAGSWINAVDTNVPSPESLMRQALYGKRFFRTEFGKVSQDVFLPDCFGFGFALPSAAAASGIKAFSTQKLSWGAAFPPPFAVGRWKGVDGSTLVSELRPGDYVASIQSDPSVDAKWNSDLVSLGNGKSVGFRYFGVGDQGGAPDAQSVEWVEKAIANRDGKVIVRNTSADQLSRDLSPSEIAALPEYQGELLLKTHGVGCYTSQSAMKTFNRQNELLANATERAGVAAELVGGLAYPRERLRDAWTRFLWHQFHDDLTGTSIPQAYEFSWNDELISLNQFASMLTDAVRNTAAAFDTRTAGVPLVVYNPIASDRHDVVEATVQFRGPAPRRVRVIDRATGKEVLSQVLSATGRSARLLFVADVPSVGFKVFEVVAGAPVAAQSTLKVSTSGIENARYRVGVDANGSVSSIFDKDAGAELLKAPISLQMLKDDSARWPAWEIDYQSVTAAPQATLANPKVRVVEQGPVRSTIEITRTSHGSTVTERLSLTEGGQRVDFATDVDWKTPGMLLKAAFPLAATNRVATYDLGIGTVERGNNEPNRYEVPAQQWADVTDSSRRFGAAILNDSKYGWDKPDDNTLRLTLVRTPMPTKNFVYQSSNDIGQHHFTYSVAGHRGDWRDGMVPMHAMALNQPLLAFQTTAHGGALGGSFSLMNTQGTQGHVAVRAVKKAEDSDEIIVRVQELWGAPAQAIVAFANPIAAAREVNAAEEAVKLASVAQDGKLRIELGRYQTRTFALKLPQRAQQASGRQATVLDLPFNLDGFSTDANRKDGNFDGKGQTLAAELLPENFEMHGVPFRFGSSAAGARNVLVPNGQTIQLPAGAYNRIYILATAVGGDSNETIAFDRKAGARVTTTFKMQEWEGVVGQWNSRIVDDRLFRTVYVAPEDNQQSWNLDAINNLIVTRFDQATKTVSGLDRIHPGFVKRDEVAWVGTHRHGADGSNQPYVLSYVFAYSVDVPKGAKAITLPANDKVRILAITVASEGAAKVTAAIPLYARDLK